MTNEELNTALFLSRRQQKSFSDGRRKSLPFSIARRNESTRNC